MKKILLFSLLLFIAPDVFAQDTLGLVAHWDFNGNANDVTGKGHDGTLHNVTSTKGENGLPNTAYYFTGDVTTHSYISVPYSPDLNMNEYSICATFMVKGFYSGLCQGNIIIERGEQYNNGTYALIFTDNDYDGGNCSNFDSAHESFEVIAADNLPPLGSWTVSPYIAENKWYSVVGIFDSTKAKVYVNGKLVNIARPSGSPSTVGSSTDGLTIGFYGLGDTVNYPYPFKGVIDDIRLYNRVLSDSEIQQYDSSTTLSVDNVSQAPQQLNIYPNPATNVINISTKFSVNANILIVNQLGQKVKEGQLINGSCKLSVADLSSGLYFIRAQTGNEVITAKFTKQ